MSISRPVPSKAGQLHAERLRAGSGAQGHQVSPPSRLTDDQRKNIPLRASPEGPKTDAALTPAGSAISDSTRAPSCASRMAAKGVGKARCAPATGDTGIATSRQLSPASSVVRTEGQESVSSPDITMAPWNA